MTTGPVTQLARLVAADPDAVALWDAHVSPPAPVTRAQLWERSGALAEELRERGVGHGDCVAVWLPNWSDAVVWQFAAASLGAHVIGVNTRYGIDEVAHVLRQARPKVVVLAHGFLRLDLAATLHAAAKGLDLEAPSIAVVTGPDAEPADAEARTAYDVGGGTWTPSGVTTGATGPEALTDHPDDLFVAFTTSGSTGRPKLAAHTAEASLAHSMAVARAGAWDAESVTLLVLPWSGVLAWNPGMAGLLSGGAVMLLPSFEADRSLDLMESHGVTHFCAADDVTGRLMRAWRTRPRDLSGLRRLLIGDFYGESPEISAWAEAETGATTVAIYGSSELFALTGFWSADDPLPLRHRGGGHVITPGTQVRSVDPVTGEETDGPGELQFRGSNVVDAYLGDVDGSTAAAARTRDGWFRTGDLGTVFADGSFEYLCRMGDSLRLKGFLVEPAEIESRLIEHPAVDLVKVVGLDIDGETRAVAFVVPAAGTEPDPDQLQAWCAETLARFKVPAQVHLIDAMPMTAGTNGAKIRAVELREMAKELAAAGTEGQP